MTALAHRLQHVVDDGVQEFLTFHVAQTTTTIVVLQLIKVLIFGPEIGKIGISRERVKVCEHSVAFNRSRVRDVDVIGVGVH